MGISDMSMNYSSIGDFVTIMMCAVFVILLKSTYTVKQKTLTLFYVSTATIFISALTRINFHWMLNDITLESEKWIYINSAVSNISLMVTFLMFCFYIENIVNMRKTHRHLINSFLSIYLGFYVLIEIFAPHTHLGLYIDENIVVNNSDSKTIFFIGYLLFAFVSSMIVYIYRQRFITKVRRCLRIIMGISFTLVIGECILGDDSYIRFSFVLPILAVLFLFHYNAYDAETGTLDIKSLYSFIDELHAERFAMIFMTLKDLTPQKKKEMTEDFFHFNEKLFVDSCTFRISDSKMVMLYKKAKNPEESIIFDRLLADFYKLYDIYQLPYKLVKIDSTSKLDKADKYLELQSQIEDDMKWNSVHICDEYDIKKYMRNVFVFNVLSDIYETDDINDERVKVFCQPVLDTKTGRFSTAEALMRLYVPEHGMIFPDEFIHIAEKFEFIHTLSKIILNKTCHMVLELEEKGYKIDRVSINFSMIELRDKNFCDDVIKIINNTGLSCEKIAIELTESRNEQDFELVKAIITKLHAMGIKIYLDDFGTGYSNFERIIGLPIDIIKFDRSLTIMASSDNSKASMVQSFADIFYNANYQVLFEGVENETDEEICKEMKAMYLQGYKYSKPIPMESLTEFLSKN